MSDKRKLSNSFDRRFSTSTDEWIKRLQEKINENRELIKNLEQHHNKEKLELINLVDSVLQKGVDLMPLDKLSQWKGARGAIEFLENKKHQILGDRHE